VRALVKELDAITDVLAGAHPNEKARLVAELRIRTHLPIRTALHPPRQDRGPACVSEGRFNAQRHAIRLTQNISLAA